MCNQNDGGCAASEGLSFVRILMVVIVSGRIFAEFDEFFLASFGQHLFVDLKKRLLQGQFIVFRFKTR